MRIYRLVLGMLGRREEAEDVVQEVFVQVFKGIDSFRQEAQLGTWIYRVAVNTCKNRAKYLARRPETRQSELEEVTGQAADHGAGGVTSSALPAPDQEVMGHQAEAIVKRCILELEPDFREVLILRDLENLSYEAICEITRAPEGTVKSRLHRARSMLKEKVSAALGLKL